MNSQDTRQNPIAIRQALARLPAWTQRFWTWLSAIAMPDETSRRPWSTTRHIVVTLITLVLAALIALHCAQALFVQFTALVA